METSNTEKIKYTINRIFSFNKKFKLNILIEREWFFAVKKYLIFVVTIADDVRIIRSDVY